MPLHERRNRLEGLLSGNDALWFSSSVQGEKARFYSGAPARWGSKASSRSRSLTDPDSSSAGQDQVSGLRRL